jgi:hypothetical protein
MNMAHQPMPTTIEKTIFCCGVLSEYWGYPLSGRFGYELTI